MQARIAGVVVAVAGAAVICSQGNRSVDTSSLDGAVRLYFDFGSEARQDSYRTPVDGRLNLPIDFGPSTEVVAYLEEPKERIKIGGYLDGYFQFDFGQPAAGDSINGRALDPAHDRLTLSIAQVEASMAPEPFGFNLQVFAGRGAELLHLTEPGGRDHYRWVRQAYVTYAPPSKNSFSLDFGKFDTWFGYETIDNRFQDEYSRSFNTTLSEPAYHTGLRVNAKLSEKLNGAFYLVNGWNEFEDSNGSMSLGTTLSYAASPKTNFALHTYMGKEGSTTANEVGSFGGIGFANPGESDVLLLNLLATHQSAPDTKLALSLDFARASNSPNRGNWNGQAFYVRHQLNENQALAFRFDRMEDTDGLRTGAPIQLHSLTGAADHAFCDNFMVRLEWRKDFASHAFFNTDSGLSKERTTFTLAGIAKF